MATFITLANFTDQGIRTVKDSPGRFQAFKAMGTPGCWEPLAVGDNRTRRLTH